jgi:hypothetical protein
VVVALTHVCTPHRGRPQRVSQVYTTMILLSHVTRCVTMVTIDVVLEDKIVCNL